MWVLGAWCELRESYRNFPLDRIALLRLEEQCYPDTPGRCSLADLVEQAKRESRECPE